MLDPNIYRIIEIRKTAIAVAIVFIPLLIWWQFFDDKIVLTSRDTGMVLEITSHRFSNSIDYWGEVETSDGEKVRISFGGQMPSKGQSIPLIVLTLESGEKEYSLDHARWP